MMACQLSRAAQQMIVAAFADREVIFDRSGVTVGGLKFLLNNRAIEALNYQAFDNAGQFAQIEERQS